MNEQELRATMLQAILAQGIPVAQAMHDAEVAVRYVLGSHAPVEPAAPIKRGKNRTNAILDMWAEGDSVHVITKMAGIKACAVYGAVNRARKAGDPRAAKRAVISDAEIAARAERAKVMRTARLGYSKDGTPCASA